jgi:CheY-like chemotaxis protein
MLIDDNNIDLYVTSRIIAKSDFGKTVIPFTSAQEALHYLKSNEHNTRALPQVIL